jgi:hypothetical protein
MAKTTEKLFYKLSERNSWEGETWNFYFQVEGNEPIAEAAKRAGSEYSISDKLMLESEVDALVKNSRGGYMNYHNKLNGSKVMPQGLEGEELFEFFYKGKLMSYFNG